MYYVIYCVDNAELDSAITTINAASGVIAAVTESSKGRYTVIYSVVGE